MKRTNILYWIFTIIFAGLMLVSAIPDAMVLPETIKFMTALGYPKYIIAFLGWAKILGVIAVLIPGFPRIKEWAYAGLAIDLVGATYSVISIGTPIGQWSMMLIWMVFLVLSYVFYHKKMKAVSTSNLLQ
jgi:uncharacterized membrane protein YphA (DoxX/SURF4 family)